MSNTFFSFDLHLHHNNILNFKMPDGITPLRPFSCIEEHDEIIIQKHNRLVKPEDRWYCGGDISIGRKYLPLLKRLNGRKKLIKGNHDIFKLKDYLPYFEDIVSYRTYPKQNLIVSHIPVHEGQLENRFKWNIHGHTHGNHVKKKILGFKTKKNDPRYINLCLEWTDFKPVSFDEILEKIGWEKN